MWDVQNGWKLDHFILVGAFVLTHVLDHAPSQVVQVPARLNNCHTTTGHQTGTGTVCEPLVRLVEDLEVAVQHVLFGVWVVNQQEVSTATRNGTANTASEILAAHVRVPASCGLGVSRKADCWENLTVCLGVDDVSHLPTEVHREVCGVGHHHDLLVWVSADEPRWEVDRHKLALAVARRDVHAQAVFLTLGDLHQQVSQDAVVFTHLVVGLHVLAELDQVVITSRRMASFG